MTAIMSVYKRLPIAFTHGEGIWLFDEKNEPYLDAIAGIGVCALGHAHPAVTEAIQEQAGKLIHTGNIFRVLEQELFADELMAFSGMEKVFFSNSGAEANEAAFKLARLYGHEKEIEVPQVLVFENGFHGRTLAMISASASRKIQAGFEPLVSGFIRAPYNNIEAIQSIAEHNKNIVAVMLEPVEGNAGIIIPDKDYLDRLRQLCDSHGWLLILDEVQTGVGRTGANYAYMHSHIKPDILTSAKALANGIPIGACMARGVAADLFRSGSHGSTFGGNPFVCHVARSVLKTIKQDKIVENVNKVGPYLLKRLQAELSKYSEIKEIRGIGLMIGIELAMPCAEIYHDGLRHKVLFNVAKEKIIRLLPPLILTEQDADELVKRLDKTINDFLTRTKQ